MAVDRKNTGKKPALTPGEKRRLRQLMACLILFAVVFLGRGVNLGPVSQLSAAVGELVRSNTDFQAVFSQVGESFSKGEPAVETFRSLWSGLLETDAEDDRPDAPAPEAGETSSEASHGEIT